MCIGAYFAHGLLAGCIAKLGPTRLDRIRARRHARRQGSRHGHLAHGGKLPRAEPGTDELRRGAATGLYTRQGVAVTVEAVAQIKVRSDQASILTAAEQFLTKPQQQREGLIRLVMEEALARHYRPVDCRADCEKPEMVGERMRAPAPKT